MHKCLRQMRKAEPHWYEEYYWKIRELGPTDLNVPLRSQRSVASTSERFRIETAPRIWP